MAERYFCVLAQLLCRTLLLWSGATFVSWRYFCVERYFCVDRHFCVFALFFALSVTFVVGAVVERYSCGGMHAWHERPFLLHEIRGAPDALAAGLIHWPF